MHIYEFECVNEKCQKHKEPIEIITRKFYNGEEHLCPECCQPLKKLISSFGFSLSGTGWHKTDYTS